MRGYLTTPAYIVRQVLPASRLAKSTTRREPLTHTQWHGGGGWLTLAAAGRLAPRMSSGCRYAAVYERVAREPCQNQCFNLRIECSYFDVLSSGGAASGPPAEP